VDVRHWSFPIVTIDQAGQPAAYCGNAFPITPDGGLLTCRHVIERLDGDGEQVPIAVVDPTTLIPKLLRGGWHVPDDSTVDLAFLPRARPETSNTYLPFVTPETLGIGLDVFTPGYFAPSGRPEDMSFGYFRGHVVSAWGAHRDTQGWDRIALPYPVIEGLSGSPVITERRNGWELVGICHGSDSHRVLAYEVVDVEEGSQRYREQLHRIVEFGAALGTSPIREFLDAESVTNYEVATAPSSGIPPA
jgi:hypothetical protein